MLVNSENEILISPDTLLQGDLSNAELRNLFYNVLFAYIDNTISGSCVTLRLDIGENLKSVVAIAVSDLLFDASNLFTASTFSATNAKQLAQKCTQAKAQIKQVLLLGGIEEKLVHPDKTLVIFYQYVPEIYEAITNHNIFELKQSLQKSINSCVMTSLNKEHQSITLTDANTGTKIAWYFGETLLKVALNMVSMSLGGALIDS